MNTPVKHFDLNLERSALFNLPDAAGVQIVCRDGTVWITLDNDLRDYVLEAGDTFTNAEHKRALIYAMRPSTIAITSGMANRGHEWGLAGRLQWIGIPVTMARRNVAVTIHRTLS